MRFNGSKRDIVQMEISGKTVAAMVMEIGQRKITVLNLRTGRLCRIDNPKPRVKKIAVSQVATETTAVMNTVMETSTEALENILAKIM